MNFVVIGSSAAGIGALEAIRQKDKVSAVTIVSDEDYPVYSRCLLSYYLAGTVDEPRLRYRPDDFYKKMNTKVKLGRTAMAIEPERQQVICDDGGKIDYDKLLIATGSRAKLPAQIPADIQGVFMLRSVMDANAIKDYLKNVRHVIIAGGGLVGLKAATALRKHGLDVTVVVRSRHVLSQMIDAKGAQMVQMQLKSGGIRVLTQTDVKKVMSRDARIVAVEMEKSDATTQTEWPCDLLLAAKGVEANMDLIAATDIERQRGIVTDAGMRTNIENIYAAGDVAETYDIALEERTSNALWTCAVQQGKIAGLNMAGFERMYDGSMAMNALNFSGLDLISFGQVRPPEGEGFEIIESYQPEQSVYKKVVLKDNRIKGIVLVNKIGTAGILSSLLSRKVDVAGFKEELVSDRFNFARLVAHRGEEELSRYRRAAFVARNEL